jgi:putative transposase
MGRQGYPPEFRRRVRDLIEGARDLGISPQTIYNSRQQDRSTGTWARSIEGGKAPSLWLPPPFRGFSKLQICYVHATRLLPNVAIIGKERYASVSRRTAMGHRRPEDETEQGSQAQEHPALPEQPRGGWGSRFQACA